jgi:hypothetical protein
MAARSVWRWSLSRLCVADRVAERPQHMKWSIRQRAQHRGLGGAGGLYECDWVHAAEATGTCARSHRWRLPMFHLTGTYVSPGGAGAACQNTPVFPQLHAKTM